MVDAHGVPTTVRTAPPGGGWGSAGGSAGRSSGVGGGGWGRPLGSGGFGGGRGFTPLDAIETAERPVRTGGFQYIDYSGGVGAKAKTTIRSRGYSTGGRATKMGIPQGGLEAKSEGSMRRGESEGSVSVYVCVRVRVCVCVCVCVYARLSEVSYSSHWSLLLPTP